MRMGFDSGVPEPYPLILTSESTMLICLACMLFLRFFWWMRLGTIQWLGLFSSGTRSMPSSRVSQTLPVGGDGAGGF